MTGHDERKEPRMEGGRRGQCLPGTHEKMGLSLQETGTTRKFSQRWKRGRARLIRKRGGDAALTLVNQEGPPNNYDSFSDLFSKTPTNIGWGTWDAGGVLVPSLKSKGEAHKDKQCRGGVGGGGDWCTQARGNLRGGR